MEQLIVIRAIAALDDAIAPRGAFRNQPMNPSGRFNRFGEGGFTLWMGGVLHGENHGVVGKDDKKGESWSKAR